MNTPTTPAERFLGFIFGCILSAFLFGGLTYWYAGLWLSKVHLAFWSQALPFSAIISPFFIAIGKDKDHGALNAALKVIFGILFLGSIIAQSLVWVGLLTAPIF